MFNIADVTLVLVTDANILIKVDMEARERIKKAYGYLRDNGIVHTQQDVANIMNVKKENISRAFNGNEDYLTSKFMERFNNAFNGVFDIKWLQTGEGNMLKTATNDGIHSVISSSDIKDDDYSGTLVYDINATCGTDCRDIFSTEDNVIGSVNLPGVNKQSHIIRANGDSMEPEIYDGNMVAVREIKSWDDIFYGQIYLVILDEYRMIKRIRRYEHDEDNYVILRSENAKYDDIKLHKGKIRKLFVVENILSVKNMI